MPYPSWGPYWNNWDDWYSWDNDFAAGVVAGAVVGTAVGLAVGTTVTALPAGCVTVVKNGIAYEQCGSVWYKPQYVGTSVQYVVINAP